jgi:vitamin-K-epoxide reductase (warfarin-sensitive)
MRFLVALVALAGLVVATLALRVHYSTELQPCSINEKWDCGIVNHSPYAVLGGVPFLGNVPVVKDVPVAAVGMAGYLALAVLALMRRRRLVLAGTLAGLAFALYLTHIEKDVLMVWCIYCVTSLGIISLETLLALGWAFAGRRKMA